MAEWRENQLPTPTERLEHWVMYFDGSLKLKGAGAGGTLDLSKKRTTQVCPSDLLEGLKQ
jgi:hypothetical protein